MLLHTPAEHNRLALDDALAPEAVPDLAFLGSVSDMEINQMVRRRVGYGP